MKSHLIATSVLGVGFNQMDKGSFYISIVQILFFLLAFSLPLSVDVFFRNNTLGLSIPAEPLLFMLSLLSLGLCMQKKYRSHLFLPNADRKTCLTDLRLWIFLYLIWFLLSSFFSQMPLVSIKAGISKLWFILPAFVLPLLIRPDFKQQKKWLFLFLLALSLVVCYTLYQRYTFPNFHVFLTNRTMRPFFNDHTQYSAVLAMFLPLAVYFGFYASRKIYKYLSFFMAALLLTGIIVSLCRAALLSLFPAFVVFVIVVFKIKWRSLFIGALATLGLLACLWIPVQKYAQTQSASKSNHPIENILSLANFKNDASSMERINRWKCSYKIFQDYPIFGSGAASYSFIYAPYQDSADMTELSTMEGDNGNAHNEFLTALSDTGFPGFLFFSLVVIFTFITAIQVYHKQTRKECKYFILALTLGLLTYYVHAISNNFLDTAKVALPLFYFTSILVLFHTNSKKVE
ncbi:MAG: O-antigen ligase family protein [Bacteroidales bacterium]